MGDPRNVAHAKKVVQEKRNKDKHPTKTGAAAIRPAKKAQAEKKKQDVALERCSHSRDWAIGSTTRFNATGEIACGPLQT